MASYELLAESLDEDFFRAGADGSYATGAHSLYPLVLEEDVPPVLDAAWLARRARLTRAVSWAVGALGIFAVLAPLVHTLRAAQLSDSSEFQSPAHAVVAIQPPSSNAAPVSSVAVSSVAVSSVAVSSVAVSSVAVSSVAAQETAIAHRPSARAVVPRLAAIPAKTLPTRPLKLTAPKLPVSTAASAKPSVPGPRAASVARFPDPS